MYGSTLKYIAFLWLAGFLVLGEANAAAFLKLGDIKGESTDANHDGWIDVLSVSHGVHKPGGGATGQSRRRGGAVFEDISIAKSIDASSPMLMLACAQGKVIKEVTLKLTQNNSRRTPYLTYTLKNVIVTSYNVNATDDGNQEEFTLSYSEIKMSYSKTSRDGRKADNVEANWKVEEGRQ